MAALVMHINREVIAHGAGICLLRDLYRAQRDAQDPVVAAARRGDAGEVSRLLDGGAAVPPSLVAEMAGLRQWGVVRALVEHGAAVDVGNPSALHYAAAAGERAIVELLLDHGADRELADAQFGMTPAVWADHFGHGDVSAHLRGRPLRQGVDGVAIGSRAASLDLPVHTWRVNYCRCHEGPPSGRPRAGTLNGGGEMRSARVSCLAVVVALLAFGLGGCMPDSRSAGDEAGAEGVSASARPPSAAGGSERIAPSPLQSAVPSATEPVISEPTQIPVTFSAVVDGDTVETSLGTVRLIGIDSPELGECGHDEASMAIGRVVSVGEVVTLELPEGQNDRDSYGRLLRYVITESGVDLGLMQVEAGNAIARYDSTDGYPAHPRQADYRAAQIAAAGPDGSVVTVVCRDEPQESVAPLAAPVETEEPWWEQYGSCSRLKKNTVGHPTGPFSVDDPAEVDIYNWFQYGTGHSGDGDNDGLACE